MTGAAQRSAVALVTGKIKRDFALKRFLSAFSSFPFIPQLIALDNVVAGCGRGLRARRRGTCNVHDRAGRNDLARIPLFRTLPRLSRPI